VIKTATCEEEKKGRCKRMYIRVLYWKKRVAETVAE
jgi:hypothetical protein